RPSRSNTARSVRGRRPKALACSGNMMIQHYCGSVVAVGAIGVGSRQPASVVQFVCDPGRKNAMSNAFPTAISTSPGAMTNAELKACMVLERLHDRLHDATVDYKLYRGKHEFAIRHAGFRFKVRFDEQALLRKGIHELEQAIAQIIERIQLNSKARPAADDAAAPRLGRGT